MRAAQLVEEFISKRFPGSLSHRVAGRVLAEGLRAADPEAVVSKNISVEGDCVFIAGEDYCGLEPRIIGFGKASRSMSLGVVKSLQGRRVEGIVIAPRGHGGSVNGIRVLEGDHPVPGRATLESSRTLLDYARHLPEKSLAIVLISGGGSALFEVPAPPVTLKDIAVTTSMLLRSGADIWELNAVRKHLSLVKGGQLARHIRAERIVSLIISDVVGDRLDTIASGPTVPDETTFEDAKNVLEKYGLWSRVPQRVRERIERGLKGLVPETPKPGDPVFEKVSNRLVASNIVSLKAMERFCESSLDGYDCLVLTSRLRGEAREAAKVLASITESVYYDGKPVASPAVIIAGGETTVTVRGNGVGGRNQELCLSLALELARTRFEGKYVAICMGSDGIDGNSPAAGAIIDENTIREAKNLGISPQEYLANNDSYSFFKKLGRTIETGYTGTNVNDFVVIVVG